MLSLDGSPLLFHHRGDPWRGDSRSKREVRGLRRPGGTHTHTHTHWSMGESQKLLLIL